MVQAEPFTAMSYSTYATCVSQTVCDDWVERADCLLRLDPIEPAGHDAACAQISLHAAACANIDATFLSSAGCKRVLARFTKESVEAFADCLSDAACNDAQATAQCSLLLSVMN